MILLTISKDDHVCGRKENRRKNATADDAVRCRIEA
jgi:hypothetical protein